MSRQVRYRVAALALGGLLLGAPLLTNGTASAEQATATGRGRIVGPGFGEPIELTTVPSGPRNSTRPFTASVTARMPFESAATPEGVLNCPSARPEVPNDRSRRPETSKTSMRSLPVFAT